jgi:glycosyltransferase involved in cell wall biosynthesis
MWMETFEAVNGKDPDKTCGVKLAILGSRGIPARYGGYETFAEQLGIRLAQKGIQVTVFCPANSPKEDSLYQGVNLRYVVEPKIGAFTQIMWDVKCFCLARHEFDVVYMLGVGASFSAWIPRIFGTKVWINTDGLEWKRSKWNLLQRVYLWLAEAMAVLLATRVISTIAYGAQIPASNPSLELLQPWSLNPDGYYVVVCRLEPENHVREIILGFEQSNSKVPLIILGNIREPNRYVQSLLELSSDRVRFIGTVYDADRLAALRFYSRGYIHGHSVGGTNPSLLEAMACGNLIIAHDNCFNREVLGDCGQYFRDSSGLCAIVNAVDKGQICRDEVRLCAVSRIQERYQWNQIADQYWELLSK